MAAAPVLESLPPELQIHVLEEIPDVLSLRSLIQASPVYRRTYLHSRRTVLHQLVTKSYGLVDLADPVAAVGSDGLHAEIEADKPEIIALLDRRRRYSYKDRLLPETLSLRLLQLYEKLSFVLQACYSQVPYVLHTATDTPSRYRNCGLSTAERARILRALCRLQTYCNIFGARQWTDPVLPSDIPQGRHTTWHRHFTIDEMWSLFFRTMPPWEVEELGSIWTLVRQAYQTLFADIALEFNRNSQQWKDLRPATMPMDMSELYLSDEPDDEYEYDNETYDDYCNHLVSLGPCFLSKVLHQTDEHERRKLLASNSVTDKSSLIDLVNVVSMHQPLIYPADKYETDNIANILSALPEMERPSTAWKQHWYGDRPIEHVMRAAKPGASTYSHEEISNDEVFQRPIGFFPGWTWGYAFWSSEFYTLMSSLR